MYCLATVGTVDRQPDDTSYHKHNRSAKNSLEVLQVLEKN